MTVGGLKKEEESEFFCTTENWEKPKKGCSFHSLVCFVSPSRVRSVCKCSMTLKLLEVSAWLKALCAIGEALILIPVTWLPGRAALKVMGSSL